MNESTQRAVEDTIAPEEGLMSDRPGIVDDTSDGDLGANAGEPQYGSLAEHEAADARREGGADRDA